MKERAPMDDSLLGYVITFLAGAMLMFGVYVLCAEEMALFQGAMVCQGEYERLLGS